MASRRRDFRQVPHARRGVEVTPLWDLMTPIETFFVLRPALLPFAVADVSPKAVLLAAAWKDRRHVARPTRRTQAG